MKNRIIFSILLLTAFAVFLFSGCGGGSSDQGTKTDSEAKWGKATWGDDKWNK